MHAVGGGYRTRERCTLRAHVSTLVTIEQTRDAFAAWHNGARNRKHWSKATWLS